MLTRTYVILCLSLVEFFTALEAEDVPTTTSTTTTSTTSTTTTSTTTLPPEKMQKIRVEEYTFVRGHRLNFEGARQACKDDDQQLINIETEEKWNELTKIIYDLGFDQIPPNRPNLKQYDDTNDGDIKYTVGWVDCKEQKNADNKSEYFWKNGDKLHYESSKDKASWWYPTQPNFFQVHKPDGPYQECLTIWSTKAYAVGNRWKLGLNDDMCDYKEYYICEENDNNYPDSTCD